MKKNKQHKWVVITEIITLIGIIGVLACLIFMIVKAGDTSKINATNDWRYHIGAWLNSVQAKSGFDVTTVVLSLIFSVLGFVFGLISMISGIKAKRFVGIWYFFELDAAGSLAGLGISTIVPLLKIKNLNVGFKYYAPLLFAFIGGILLFVFAFIQFVLFARECKKCRETMTIENNENPLPEVTEKSTSNDSETTSVENKVEETNNENDATNEQEEVKVVEEKPVSDKKETTVTKKSSQTTSKTSNKPVAKKVDNNATNDTTKKDANAKPSVKSSGKVYHISQHGSTNKWQVKLAKGEKALKLFDTQAEAITFAKEMAAKQGGSIRVHSKVGKIRKA